VKDNTDNVEEVDGVLSPVVSPRRHVLVAAAVVEPLVEQGEGKRRQKKGESKEEDEVSAFAFSSGTSKLTDLIAPT
jgi:hypothetical protein